MKVFGREIRFGTPENADIVIFDECNHEIVRKVLDPQYSVAVFKVRPEELWVSIRVLLFTLRFLYQVDLVRAATYQFGLVRGLLWQVRFVYFKACLQLMKPKAVVTFIDNNPKFHWLSKNCESFPFVAIQNGSRLSYASPDSSDYFLQHLFCWGAHETKLLPQLGAEIENFYPVGSLLASLHFDQSTSGYCDEYDLLIVSCWRGDIGWPQDVIDTMRSMEIMDKLLNRYIKSRNLKAGVMLRTERDSSDWNMTGLGNEYDYFKKIYGESTEIIETDFRKRNIFPTMQRGHVIVSCLSSAILEAFGIGKKILYCNFTGTNKYHADFSSAIVTEDSSWESFSAKLDKLRRISMADYRELNAEYAAYLMAYPSDNSTQDVIRQTLHEIIVKKRGANDQ